jgi:hypothetical protein
VGGPEITPDNAWVLESPHVDFAAIGEGEQTFTELLQASLAGDPPRARIPGLYVAAHASRTPLAVEFRRPLANLDDVSSPYLDGILDAREESMLLLETIRGCIFKCKFCYYPKSYDDLYFMSRPQIEANLAHARDRGVREVVLLDPTLNQRRDFAGFLRLLCDCNPDRSFTYFGELRAEGIDAEIAALLRRANFTEVEIGLQSTDVEAQRLMDRRNNMRAFERGVRSMLDAGIRVKIDLIVGLPGDTLDSVRRSMHWVRESGLYTDVQVFNLAVLPGTAFRHEAGQLGLEFQPRPPYYVLRTPALQLEDFYMLMEEAEELFDTEFDALPPPMLPGDGPGAVRRWTVDLDAEPERREARPAAIRRAQSFTLHVQGARLGEHREACVRLIDELLRDNPHTTLQVVLEPRDGTDGVTPVLLETLRAACYRDTTYLDRFYAILPGSMKGSKRLVLVLPGAARRDVDAGWIDSMAEHAAILWRGGAAGELQEHEYECGIP